MKTTLISSDYGVFDLLLEGIQVIDYSWRYVYANHTMAIPGKDKQDIHGHSILELYPEIRHTPLFGALETCMNERVSQFLTCELACFAQGKGRFDFMVFPVEEGILIMSKKTAGNEATTHKVNWEYAYQAQEREKRAAELVTANIELCFQNDEKEKRAEEFIEQTLELSHSQNSLVLYLKGLEDMMFLTSHKVRQPIANILGITDQLENNTHTKEEMKEIIIYLRQSALALDVYTNELTALMGDLNSVK